jgi:hypothetical protein
MRDQTLSMRAGGAVIRRFAFASLMGAGLALVALPSLAFAADPSASPDPSAIAESSPSSTSSSTSTQAPVATADAPASPSPSPTPDATPTTPPAPAPTADPTATPAPAPTPEPTPGPTPGPTPSPPPVAAGWLNLFVAAGFQFQNPNWAACTATSVRTMLNFISFRSTGGVGFQWQPTNRSLIRDRILAWERAHDTMAGGNGSDPHGWRNALNFYGWGAGALSAGARVYEDYSSATFDGAVKAAVRAVAATGKPVGMLGWRGAHAQMLTGYFGLIGDPFAKDAAGHYTNAFSVGGVYLTDPLRESAVVNRRISYTALRYTMNYRLRFQPYYQKDSRLDDPYTPGYRVSRTEWYGRFVLILPTR